MIGNIIGSNFKIIEKLGEGGMGAVYKGVDMMTEREVAIKALKPELASQPEVAERFRSEAVTLAKLNHPNIATLYNFFRQGDEYYMVLEFVRGETLDSLISRQGAMPVEQAVPLFCKVLEGIDHAHEEGIVHRDIKPANMMLTSKGALKVLDFGIARILGTARMTRAGHLIGTIEYMAPEQVKGLETDARSDIYSLGMLLYEMLTGRVPFDIQNEFDLMSAQINQMPRPPRELNPDIPAEVEEAIMRAVAKEPEARYQTAGEFRDVLMSAGIPMTGARVGFTTGSRDNPYAPRTGDRTSPSSQPVTTSPPSSGGTPKETRLGVSPITLPTGDGGVKETRLGTAPMPTQQPGPGVGGAIARPQAAPGSFFSKLKPIHFIGAGVALLVVFGLLIAVPLMLLMSTGKGETAKPSAEQPAAAAPVTQPSASTPESQQAGIPTGVVGGGDASAIPATGNPAAVKQEATTQPLPASGLTIDTPKTSAASSKAAAKPPKARTNDAAAAEARRKREAALRALDQ